MQEDKGKCFQTKRGEILIGEKKGRLLVSSFCFFKYNKALALLPREVLEVPSLKALRVRLDGALSNLTELLVSLFMAGKLD